MMLLLAPAALDAGAGASSPLLQYGQVLLALVGVLVLVYVVLRVGLPRFFGMRMTDGGPLQVLARYPLEPKKTLYLVKMGSQVLLIATSETQVQFLTSVAPENVPEMMVATSKAADSQKKMFRPFLGSFRQL